MKRLVKVALILVAVVALGACGSKNKPDAIAKDFLTALNQMDYDKAKTFGTEETGKMVDMMKAFMPTDAAKVEEAKAKAKNLVVEITDTKIEGEKAICTYKISGIEGQEPKEDKLNLVQKDGKWLVDWKKEGMGPQTETPAEQPTDSTATAADTTAPAM